MALPPLTPEQRAAALEKAAASRRERAEVKHRLKYSQASRSRRSSREGKSNDVIGKMRVSALLESLPGVGRVRARQIMEEIGISESRRVRGLGQNQVARAARSFRAVVTGSVPPHRPRRTDRRRQGHRRGLRPPAPPRGLALGLGDHPSAPPGRGRRRALPLRLRRASSTRWPAPASCSSGPSCTAGRVRHPAPPGRGGARRRRPGAARDRPAGRAPGARDHAGGPVRLPRPADLGRAGAPAGRPGHRGRGGARGAGWPPRGSSWTPRRSSTSPCVNDDVPARRLVVMDSLSVDGASPVTPKRSETDRVRNQSPTPSASPTRRSTSCWSVRTPSTRSSSTRPSGPGRSTPTTPSCRRACSSTSARWSTPRSQEKPLSIALREINEGLLTSTPTEG